MAGLSRLSYIVCRNITEVFRAEKVLGNGGLAVRTVPAPPKEAGQCATVLEITSSSCDEAACLLREAGIAVTKLLAARPQRGKWAESLIQAVGAGTLAQVVRGLLEGVPPTQETLRVLLKATGQEQQTMFDAADRVRRNTVGEVVDIRGALEFSNHCVRSCLYCGLRRENRGLSRYRMDEDTIVRLAGEMNATGLRTVILQSGEDPWYTTGRMARIISRIKSETGMRITLSLGERRLEEYGIFKAAGASNYLLKVETTDPDLYSKFHPGTTVLERMEHVRAIKKAGYITGSGNIVGLPGQDVDKLARDILWLWQEGIHMIGIGPFIPAPNTPLENYAPGSADLCLKTMAAARLVCRNSYIPSTTALASISRYAQLRGLSCGANTVMLIMTPLGLREKYMIYGNKTVVDLAWALEMIETLGRRYPPEIKTGEVGQVE